MPYKMNKPKFPINMIKDAIRKKNKQNYNKRHQQLRLELLQKFPLCQCKGCNNCCNGKAWSEEADHLIYPATELDHYQALCCKCHREKTKLDYGR